MIGQFHDFLKSNVWRVFDVWPNCGSVRTARATAALPLPPKYEKANQDNKDTNEIEYLVSKQTRLHFWDIIGSHQFQFWAQITEVV